MENVNANYKIMEVLYDKISILQYFPRIGSIYEGNKERFLIYKNFLIFYEIQESEKIIEILTVIHRKRNY